MFLSAWLADASSLLVAIVISFWLLRRTTHLPSVVARLRKWSGSPVLLCAVIALVPPLLRLALLPWLPIPHPFIHDEFGHLLIADTFLSGRIANPTHPFWQHFETIYVLQQPTYSSIYPLAQGAVLALGQVLFGHPWFGVVATAALMNAGIYWMLFPLAGPRWAALGCLVASLQLGIMSYWMNSYWGGYLGAIAGCLVFGGMIRFLRSPVWLWAASTGLGLAILWHIRPFETVWMTLMCVGYVVAKLIKGQPSRRPAALMSFLVPVGAWMMLTLAVTGYHNYRVTGDALTLPYQLCQQQYGVPVGLIWQHEVPKPKFTFKDVGEMYEAQRKKRLIWSDWDAFRKEYSERAQLLWFIYISPSLTIPLIGFFVFRPKIGFPVIGFLVPALLATNFYPFLNAHYLAGYTPLVIALLVFGLKALWESPRLRWQSLALASVLCLGIATVAKLSFLFRLEPDFWRPHGDPWSVAEDLQKGGGKHLVLVRYAANHDFRYEWVYNRADIDTADVVWAREVSPEKDRDFLRYYRDRQIWVLNADDWPPVPRPYQLLSRK